VTVNVQKLTCIVAVRTLLFIHQQSPPDIFRESVLVSDSASSRVFLGYRFVGNKRLLCLFLYLIGVTTHWIKLGLCRR